jgi:succinate dehydrogenase / fumarate reductase flavoprotein subunit
VHPGLRREPVEAHADERVPAQRRPDLGAEAARGLRQGPAGDPEEDRDYYLERIYPSFGNLVPRDIASRQAKNVCDEGRGVGPLVGDFRRGVYLDFTDALKRMSAEAVAEKYGNLLDMYQRITGENPYEVPMRIYPAVHYTMGGLWVDYDLQSNIPGSSSRARRTSPTTVRTGSGASALMQGLADGYFVLPEHDPRVPRERPVCAGAGGCAGGRRGAPIGAVAVEKLLSINGSRTVDSFHRELGNIMWEYCGMERSRRGCSRAST